METTPRTLRVNDPASLLASVPYLLGFVPHDDLVVVVTSPSTRRVELTMRLDLPGTGPDRRRYLAGAVEALATPLSRLPGTRAYVVLYPAGEVPTSRPDGHDDLVAAVSDGIEDTGTALGDVLVVAGQRWWSLLCDDPGCCPEEGRPLDTGAAWAVRAELVATGRAPVASREEVVARVAALPVEGAGPLREACVRERTAVADRRRDLGALVAEMLELAATGAGAAQADVAVRARFLAGLTHLAVRDVVVGELLRADGLPRATGDPDAGERGLAREAFVALTRQAPPGFVAPVATCAAVLAYTSGEGALAWAAWDRATDDDPSYSLARLLESAMRGGLPPQQLREAFTAFLEVRDTG